MKNKKRTRIIIIVLILLVLIAVGVFFYKRHNNKKRQADKKKEIDAMMQERIENGPGNNQQVNDRVGHAVKAKTTGEKKGQVGLMTEPGEGGQLIANIKTEKPFGKIKDMKVVGETLWYLVDLSFDANGQKEAYVRAEDVEIAD